MSDKTPAPECPACRSPLQRLFLPQASQPPLSLIGMCMECATVLWRMMPPKAVTEAELRQFEDEEQRSIRWVQKALRDRNRERFN